MELKQQSIDHDLLMKELAGLGPECSIPVKA